MGSDTYYDILGVSPTATPDEIKAKYRKLIQRIHPDLDGPAALFRQVQEAYEVLSDPARRATYDRSLTAQGGAARTSHGEVKTESSWEAASNQPRGRHSGSGPRRAGAARPRNGSTFRVPVRNPMITSFPGRHPAGAVACAGMALLLLGAALGHAGRGVLVLGSAALIIAGIAGRGGRGAKEREAYQRSGMAAVDAMTGRQFEVLLEHFFANKGYRVARIGGRGELGADLLVNDAHGGTIVQAKRWTGVVRHDAVQQAVIAMARYGVARALVVTSSTYSEHAVAVANSNGVTLWDRATLAAELSVFRREPIQSGIERFSLDLRAGSRICLGFMTTLLVALVTVNSKARRRTPAKRRRE